ncbi:periplasmic binding protein-like I [Zopfochytrium polystomum]|nr:periplasmic binding protein-like I [Zopfochytrium polystomum]
MSLQYLYIFASSSPNDSQPLQTVPNQAVVKAMDAGFQLAIEDVNSDPKILPDVNVFLKRVNALVLFDDKFTGGYPAVNFYSTAVRDSTIIGGSGFLTDLAATSIGEVASQLGLPFCGAAQQSPIYSNKLVFPTFFRTTPNAGMLGPTIRLLHEKMGARRVSIISTTDYKDATDSIRRHLEMHNFDIVTRAEMKPTPTEDERNGVMNILKYEDSRYFIVLANPYDTATIYFAARNFSMVGPRYMWTAINFPYPRGESFDEDFGAGSSRDLEGLIGFSTYSNNASPYLAKFKQDYRTFQSLFPYWFFTDNGIVPILAAQTYDCVKLMLVGIDNAMKSHNATVEDLFSGRLKPFLTASAFSLPNYNGPTGAPLRLDSNGDLQTTTTILQFNTSDPTNFLEAGIVIGEVYPGESPTLRESGTLITAYGGSTKLPPDGSVERVRISNDLHHGDGLIIAILGCIGALASVAAAATSSRYANRLAFRAASPLLTATLCLGCFLIFSSAVASVDEVTSLKCRARLWLQLMGFTVFVGSIIFKVGRVALVLSSGRSLTASYFTDYVGLGVTGVLAAVEALLLGAWSIAQNPKPSFEVDAFTEKWVCRSTLPPEARYPGHIFLYVYNLLLLAGALYLALRAQSLERHYSSRAADTAAAITALSATLFLAVVALPLLETAEPGPRTDLARFAVVWAVAMFALLVIVGSKLIALGYQTRREQGELTSLDSNPASSSICRSSSSYALHRTAYCRLIPVTRVKSLVIRSVSSHCIVLTARSTLRSRKPAKGHLQMSSETRKLLETLAASTLFIARGGERSVAEHGRAR